MNLVLAINHLDLQLCSAQLETIKNVFNVPKWVTESGPGQLQSGSAGGLVDLSFRMISGWKLAGYWMTVKWDVLEIIYHDEDPDQARTRLGPGHNTQHMVTDNKDVNCRQLTSGDLLETCGVSYSQLTLFQYTICCIQAENITRTGNKVSNQFRTNCTI